jgi:hypothetical protein
MTKLFYQEYIPVLLFYFMTFYWMFNKSNITCVTIVT